MVSQNELGVGHAHGHLVEYGERHVHGHLVEHGERHVPGNRVDVDHVLDKVGIVLHDIFCPYHRKVGLCDGGHCDDLYNKHHNMGHDDDARDNEVVFSGHFSG